MKTRSNAKVVFVHPAVRPYRYRLFQLLEQTFDVSYLFTEDYADVAGFLVSHPLKSWRAFKPTPLPFYRKGIAWPVVKEAMRGVYDVWVGSGLNHSSTHAAFLIVKQRKKPFVLFSEDWWEAKNVKTMLAKPYARYIATHADAIIAASSRTKRYFLDLGAAPERVHVALNATEAVLLGAKQRAEAKKLKEKLKLSDGVVVLYLGRLVRYKGADVLVRAFAELERAGLKAELLIVGDGPFRAEVEALSENLELKRVRFLGGVQPEEVGVYYALADVFAAPARFLWEENVVAEAWGFTINEAMSAGLVVVATTAVAAAEDLIEDGVSGRIVPAEDTTAFAHAIAQLIASVDKRKSMSKAARERMKVVSPQRQYEEFAEVIRRCIPIT